MSAVICDINVSEFSGDGSIIIGTEGVDFIAPPDELIPDGLDPEAFFQTTQRADLIDARAGNDFIKAWDGDDTICGGDGDDTIDGGDGNDIINGGAGNDELFGGAGEDVFEFNAADFASDTENFVDTITDFKLNEDSIVIKGLSTNDEIAFDSITGNISVNGKEVINIQGVYGSPTIKDEGGDDYELV